MNGEKKEVIWIETLPKIGTQCPNCVAGYLKDNTFKSKKGDTWESVECEACKQKWIKSKEKKTSVTQLERVITALTASYKLDKELSETFERIEAKLGEIASLLADQGKDD